MHHKDVFVRAGGHDIAKQLEADAPLALVESGRESVECEGRGEDMTLLKLLQNPSPARLDGHEPNNYLLSLTLAKLGFLLGFADVPAF